jgi:glutamine amidotransferase
MISIIDYGLGNIHAFVNIYKSLNIQTKVVSDHHDIINADKLILPGVGAFDSAMQKLKSINILDSINEFTLIKKKPILGVCVGMQIMAKSSEEGEIEGLGWIDSNVKLFNSNNLNSDYPVPHMGWNNILPEKENILLKGLSKESFFYYLHSYYFECNDPENIIATTEYINKFTCVVSKENIFGIQFHPEKSHDAGSILLKNFSDL